LHGYRQPDSDAHLSRERHAHLDAYVFADSAIDA
jgi:hypothetical protein